MPKTSRTPSKQPYTFGGGRPVEAVRESIHAAGAERHKDDWLPANIRAVDAARAKGLDPTASPAREAIPNILLRVLDGLKVQAGLTWDATNKTWVPLAPGETHDSKR